MTWFNNPGSRWVFSSILIALLPSTHDKQEPQWLLAAHRVSAKLCVCVRVGMFAHVCDSDSEREKETVKKHTAGGFRFLQTGMTVRPLLGSSPPLLSTRPSF